MKLRHLRENISLDPKINDKIEAALAAYPKAVQTQLLDALDALKMAGEQGLSPQEWAQKVAELHPDVNMAELLKTAVKLLPFAIERIGDRRYGYRENMLGGVDPMMAAAVRSQVKLAGMAMEAMKELGEFTQEDLADRIAGMTGMPAEHADAYAQHFIAQFLGGRVEAMGPDRYRVNMEPHKTAADHLQDLKDMIKRAGIDRKQGGDELGEGAKDGTDRSAELDKIKGLLQTGSARDTLYAMTLMAKISRNDRRATRPKPNLIPELDARKADILRQILINFERGAYQRDNQFDRVLDTLNWLGVQWPELDKIKAGVHRLRSERTVGDEAQPDAIDEQAPAAATATTSAAPAAQPAQAQAAVPNPADKAKQDQLINRLHKATDSLDIMQVSKDTIQRKVGTIHDDAGHRAMPLADLEKVVANYERIAGEEAAARKQQNQTAPQMTAQQQNAAAQQAATFESDLQRIRRTAGL